MELTIHIVIIRAIVVCRNAEADRRVL